MFVHVYVNFGIIPLTLSLRNYFLDLTEFNRLFCYRFLIILDKIVHHISNESEDM